MPGIIGLERPKCVHLTKSAEQGEESPKDREVGFDASFRKIAILFFTYRGGGQGETLVTLRVATPPVQRGAVSRDMNRGLFNVRHGNRDAESSRETLDP